MAANISSTLTDWSTVAGSNQPDGTDPASSLVDDLRAIQSACRKETMTLRQLSQVQTATVTASGSDSTLDLSDKFRFCNVSGEAANSTVASMVMNSGATYNLHFIGSSVIFKSGSPLTLPFDKSTMTCVSGVNWEFSFDGSQHMTTKLENYPLGKHYREEFGGIVTVTGAEETLNLRNAYRVQVANAPALGTAATIASILMYTGQICTLRFNIGTTIIRRSGTCLASLPSALTTCTGGDHITIGRQNTDSSGVIWLLEYDIA